MKNWFIAYRNWNTGFSLVTREDQGCFESPQAICNHFNKLENRHIRFNGDIYNSRLYAVQLRFDEKGDKHIMRQCKLTQSYVNDEITNENYPHLNIKL